MDLDSLDSLKRHLNLSKMSKPALIGIVAVFVLVAVIAGARFLGTATANGFEVAKAEVAEGGSQGSAETGEETPLFVHVSGEVANPGLVELPSGSRVANAIQAAGGLTGEADPVSVNLARPLTDGEQIIVAAKFGGEGAETQVGDQPATTRGMQSGLVNVNTADASQLATLPGIGEALASRIVADRQVNGPFSSIEDVKRVSGIGDKKFEAISSSICI